MRGAERHWSSTISECRMMATCYASGACGAVEQRPRKSTLMQPRNYLRARKKGLMGGRGFVAAIRDAPQARLRETAPSPRRNWRGERGRWGSPDRKSTRLNSSHLVISYAVFCLKKKNY